MHYGINKQLDLQNVPEKLLLETTISGRIVTVSNCLMAKRELIDDS
jgi:hypothetical protein